MKRTRAVAKAASTPAAKAAPAKPATRRVRAKVEKQSNATLKATSGNSKAKSAAAKPKAAATKTKAVAKGAGGRALKQTTLKLQEAHHVINDPQLADPGQQSSVGAAAAGEPSAGTGKGATKRPAPAAAPAAATKAAKTGKAATPSKATSKAVAHSKPAAKAATPSSRSAAKAAAPSKAGGKAATPSKAAHAAKPTAAPAKAATTPRKQAAKAAAGKPVSPTKKEVFDQYRQEGEEDVIGPEGVERLCSDLDLSPEDRKVLLLAWKTGARRMGFFSRDEFRRGMGVLGAKTVAALKQALPSLEAAVAVDEAAGQDFYQFAFRYCLTDGQKKFIDTETAAQMLGVVLPDGPLTTRLQEFLAEQTEYKVISADQWLGMYRFSQEVKPDFSDFDESHAWPVLLDIFVDWARERLAQKQDAGGQ